MINLNEDKGPHFIKIAEEKEEGDSVVLNFDKIKNRLTQLIQIMSNGRDKECTINALPCELQLPLPTLRFLHASWSQFNDRIADRIDQTGTLRVTLGLKATYAAIVKHTKVMTELTSPEQDENEVIYMDSTPLPQQAIHAENTHFDFIDAHYTNISPAGFCFEWKLPLPKELVAGEIIGIEQNPDLEGILCIGMIRWIKHIDPQTVHCGVKLLSPYAIPMLTVIPDQVQQIGVKTLLLPAESRYHPYVSLLTPSLPFKEGITAAIAHGDQMYRVHLKTLVDSSSIFNQFNITFEEGQEVPFVHLCHPHQMDALKKE